MSVRRGVPRVVRFLLSSAALGAFLFVADYFVYSWRPIQHLRALKAGADNFTHGVAGGWCWLNALLLLHNVGQPVNYSHVVVETTMGVLFGSVIDLDHFVEARSRGSLAIWEVIIIHTHVIILLTALHSIIGIQVISSTVCSQHTARVTRSCCSDIPHSILFLLSPKQAPLDIHYSNCSSSPS